MAQRVRHRSAAATWRRVALGTLGVAALWVALAAWQPGTTFHLAPAVLAWVAPYLSLTAGATRAHAVLAAAAGGVVAALVSVGLAAVGWLSGPALVGGGPLAESLLVAAVATVVGVAAGAVVPAALRGDDSAGA